MKRVQVKEPPVSATCRVTVKNDPDSKKNQHRSLKVPTTRYGQQNDLREQNRILTAVNEDLQRQLEEMKGTVAQLDSRCLDLQGENREIEKQLRDCHVLLVAENLDPTVSQNLLTELKLFGEMAQEQAANLLEVQNTMRELTEAHEKLQQERSSFSLDIEDMERALVEAERLLME